MFRGAKMLDFNEIAVLDRNAQYLGVPTSTLMENAGIAVARVATEQCKDRDKFVIIFCGLGNNGGDGMVAARHLANDPKSFVKLYLLGSKNDIKSTLASEQFHRIPSRVEIIELEKGNKKAIKEISVSKFSVIIDSMLGVGITGKLKDPYKSIVKLINSTKLPSSDISSGKKRKSRKKADLRNERIKPNIISVDIPTGLGTDYPVKPDYTITFHDSKTGMNKNNSGNILVRDIGIPKEAELYVGPGELISIPKMKLESHKGDRGRLLVVGGGPYTGAPALVGLSALRTGVDLVHIATPDWISRTIATYSPNFIMHPLGSGYSYLTPIDVEHIIDLVEELSVDAVVIGPGLGRSEQTFNAVHNVINEISVKIPILLDADAFSALAFTANGRLTNLLKGHQGVLTPHKGELKLLIKAMFGSSDRSRATSNKIGSKSKTSRSKTVKNDKYLKKYQAIIKEQSDVMAKRKLLEEFCSKLGSDWTIILKGAIDIITNGSSSKLNRTGNPGMTVGGTGDVLAGITGALLAMGLEPYNAAKCAAFINGYSGDLAWERFQVGLLATDIIDLIPECIKNCMDY